MPLYRYKCKNCGEEFTSLVFVSKEEEIKCKRCGSYEVKKLLPRFFTGRTSEGKIGGISGCSTCTASSCKNCKNR